MSYTLAQATTEVRSIIDEANPQFWTDAQIQSWINQGCQDIARRAETLWQETTINVAAGVQNYPFPPDFLNCHRAEFTLSGTDQTFNLDYRGINTMDEVWGILHSLPAAWPQYFTIRGNSAMGFYLMLYPSPGASGTLTVYYYRAAQLVTVTTQNIDVQPGWEDIVFDYAVYKAKRKANDPTWQEAFQLYNGNLQQMIDKSRNMTDLGENMTTGVPQWPVYAYGEGDGSW
jgi:hypothetical protein